MSYIKYYGVTPPPSISEHVRYENPEAPCFRGSREARVLVWTRCEQMGIPRDQWDQHLREHISESPYEGMGHVGGAGAVRDHLLVRATDRIIPLAEYNDLKSAISSANEAYKQHRIDHLIGQNDPTRRAMPEHESLGWRTRVWIMSFTELTHHVPYRVDSSCYAYTRIRRYLPNGMTGQLVDLYHRSQSNVDQAIFDGLERAERLADLLALTGFGAASVSSVVGTSPPSCRQGTPFQVATLQARVRNSPVAVSPDVLADARVDEVGHLALRHLREGLSARLPTAALASLWNSLERQAHHDATALRLRRVAQCKQCGHEREVGPNTKDRFEKMYADARVDADFDRQRGLRGRVQHGDAIFSNSSLEDFMSEVSRLQSTAMVSVSSRIGIQPEVGEHLLVNMPVSVSECIVQGEKCSVSWRSVNLPAVVTILPVRASKNQDRDVEMGIYFDTPVDPLVFPPVEP